MSKVFFKNQTINATSDVYKTKGAYGQVQIAGTFDGATVQVFISQQGFPFYPISNGAVTEACVYRLNCKQSEIFFTISGAGASTDISVGIVE